jgi:hypothetical protein
MYDYGMRHGHHQFIVRDSSGQFIRPEHADSEADKVSQRHLRGEITDAEYNAQIAQLMRVSTRGDARVLTGNEVA